MTARVGSRSGWRMIGGRGMALALAVVMAVAPMVADARPGRGSSMGSRGTRTYTPPPVGQPIQRSITTPPPASAPAAPVSPGFSQPRPAFAPPMAPMQPSFGQRHPFLSGLAGGFLGASIANSLFGHGGGYYGGEYGGGAGGAFGGVLRLLMMVGIAWLIWRLVRQALGFGQQPESATVPYEVYTPAPPPQQPYASGGYDAVPASPPVNALPPVSVQMAGEDLQAFEQILQGIMAAWSRGDVSGLRRFVTPEILSYYGEELTENQSRGIVNHVADVVLLKGDVVESWREGDRTYCSAALQWRARDWTVDEASGRVVDGNEQQPDEAKEVWTFVRADGGRWLLSAIQQT